MIKSRRLIFAFLVLAVLQTVLFFLLFFHVSLGSKVKTQQREGRVLAGITHKLREFDRDLTSTGEKWLEKNWTAAKLTAAALKSLVSEEGYSGPAVFSDGFVIRFTDGQVVYPDGFPGYIDGLETIFGGSTVTARDGTYHQNAEDAAGTRVIISAEPIGNDYYYIDRTLYSEYLQDTEDYSMQAGSALRDMEQSYGSFFVVMSRKDSSMLYCSDLLCPNGSDTKLEDLEITRDMIDAEEAALTIGKNVYLASYRSMRFLGESAKVIILNPVIDRNSGGYGLLWVTVILETLIIAGFILWLFWVQRFVQSHSLSVTQANRYRPSGIRKKMAAAVVTGALVVFLASLFYQSIDNLKRESEADNTSLWLAADYIIGTNSGKTTAQQDQEEWSVYYSERIADLLSRSPELRTRPVLAAMNDVIGSEYIMLYDEAGNEIVSSNAYEGFQLGTKDDDLTKDFRRLLLGVDTIVHPPARDATTEMYSQMTGSPVRLSGEGQKYGAVILAFNSQQSWEAENEKNIRDFISRITQEGHLCVVADAEGGKIRYTSQSDLLNTIADGVGLDISDRWASDMEHFTVDGVSYYGPFEVIEDNRYYYLTEATFIRSDSIPVALLSAAGFIVCALITSLIMLLSYRDKKYKETVKISESSRLDAVLEAEDLSDEENKTELESAGIRAWWNRLLPELKIRLFLQIVTGLLLIFAAYQIFSSSGFLAQSVFGFVFRGNWTRGVNLLAISAIILVVVGYIIFLFFKSLVVDILKNVLDPKGETILRLIASLVQYGAFIGLVFISLNYLGINTTVMVAGFSAFSLAISLGGQGLVSDILAGIFIIFEDDFHVGDMIDVGGFQGIVQDIGVRSTKILGLGDNIKIIGNRDVKNVVNMTKMNTWYTMEFNVQVSQPLNEIEAMLRDELPAVGESIPEIISGPTYKGIWTIGPNAYTLAVNSECKEIDLRKVRRKLNHAILDLFDKHGYKMG